MNNLADKKCVPCEGGVEPLNEKRAKEYLKQLNPAWSISADGKKITRKFKFKNFQTPLEFVNKVGGLAESEGHHPDIEFGWGYVVIALWTHAIGGLFDNDFILAAKIDQIKISNTNF